jgi:molybdate transport system ATP-binding protein
MEEATATICLEAQGRGGTTLSVIGPSLKLGETVLIGVRAEDVMLAIKRPEGLSARNILSGRIRSLRPQAEDVTVAVSISEELPELIVKIARPTVRKLELSVDKEVFLVIKARACHVISK